MDASRYASKRARVRSLLAGLFATSLLCQCCSSLPAAQPQPAITTHYTQGTFRIPFRVSPGGRCPQSLDLLVSRDAGRSWQVHQSAAPAESAFQVAQADEGEFLVKVQARDQRAAAVSRSMMKVVVDRTEPQLYLTCDWQPEMGLLIQSQAQDRNLDTSSIRLEWRTNRQPQPVPLQQSPIGQASDSLSQQAVVPVAVCESFEIRLIAMDLAGNRKVLSQRFHHPAAAPGSELLPAWEDARPESEPRATSQGLQIEPGDWSPVTLEAPVAANSPAAKTTMHLTGYAVPSAAQSDPPSTGQPLDLTPPATSNVSLAAETPSTASLELNAPVANNQPEVFSQPELFSQPSAIAPVYAASVAQVPRVESTSRRLTLGYQFDRPGPALGVELWCSLDQGRTWSYWGNDQDCQSPCRVEVEHAGEYHFRIVSLSGPQDQVLRPVSGDPADIIVVVQPDKPGPVAAIRLQPVAY